MERLRASLLIAAILATGACKDSEKIAGSDPTVPTAPRTTATTATTEAAEPFATPATIDAPYVDRVLVELNRVYGDVVRKIVETHRYERSDIDPLGAIFNPPLLELQVNQFKEIPEFDPKLFKTPMGYRRTDVLEVITARPDCIFAKVRIDVSAVVVTPPPAEEKYLTFTPKPDDADLEGTNPTPWSMANESTARQDPCVS